MKNWHTLTLTQLSEDLGLDLQVGLSIDTALRRLELQGPNELQETGGKTPFRILWEQITSVMVIILVIAAAVSAVVADYKDAAVILAIVVLFTLLGFTQEYRAEKAMAALKKMSVPVVRVKRNGRLMEIPARELVVGDLIFFETGNVIPADCRLVEATNLRVQESALTGESEAVEKDIATLAEATLPIGDRRNMVYMGTVVNYGRGAAIVVETGMSTELGRIAGMIQSVHREPTPLQRRLDQLGRMLAAIAVLIAVVILFLGLYRGEEISLMLMTAVSLAVAAIPEGLPAVLTITLALGAQRMLRRHALIRTLPAVETLGSVTVICSDKTGTLTENRMTVTVLDVSGHRAEVAERVSREGAVGGDEPIPDDIPPSLLLLLAGGALCNDAAFREKGDSHRIETIGDPTEGALIVAAASFGLTPDHLRQHFPRIAELPFDSERKRMLTLHEVRAHSTGSLYRPLIDVVAGYPRVAFCKGAVDSLLQVTSRVWSEGTVQHLNEEARNRIAEANDEFASQGMRVLGVAFRSVESGQQVDELEESLVFIGLFGMIDPPRSEAREAVSRSIQAGIRPVMITGDHPLTALQIAKNLGIARDGGLLTGQQLSQLTPSELQERVGHVSVFARVAPEQKLIIVDALQRRGEVVSMTGDGVNDAPALRKANIGVAMGITGTDVSREAADIVLLDDNFATIVAAVEEGRVIYDNIRKFLKFSVAGNIGKILVVLIAPVLGMSLPLLPLQLLWLNLLTDGLLGLGMGVEPSEPDTMRRPPVPPGESVFARGLGRHMVQLGVVIGAIALGVGYGYYTAGRQSWQTMIFTTLAVSQLFQAFAIRSDHYSLFVIGIAKNRLLLFMAMLVLCLQLLVVYVSLFQQYFDTVSLSFADMAICVAASSVVLWVVELDKGVRRLHAKGI
jgi:Ca2+-transporting ATPase